MINNIKQELAAFERTGLDVHLHRCLWLLNDYLASKVQFKES